MRLLQLPIPRLQLVQLALQVGHVFLFAFAEGALRGPVLGAATLVGVSDRAIVVGGEVVGCSVVGSGNGPLTMCMVERTWSSRGGSERTLRRSEW